MEFLRVSLVMGDSAAEPTAPAAAAKVELIIPKNGCVKNIPPHSRRTNGRQFRENRANENVAS